MTWHGGMGEGQPTAVSHAYLLIYPAPHHHAPASCQRALTHHPPAPDSHGPAGSRVRSRMRRHSDLGGQTHTRAAASQSINHRCLRLYCYVLHVAWTVVLAHALQPASLPHVMHTVTISGLTPLPRHRVPPRGVMIPSLVIPVTPHAKTQLIICSYRPLVS